MERSVRSLTPNGAFHCNAARQDACYACVATAAVDDPGDASRPFTDY